MATISLVAGLFFSVAYRNRYYKAHSGMRSCKRWIELVCAGIVACVGLEAEAADPVVSNVRAAQRAGTGLFDITNDLADADSSTLSVTVAISTNNGAAWFETASSNLTGAAGAFAVSPGTGKTIVWQGGRELPARLFPSVIAKITADDTPLLYLAVNLSGGTAAASYPVTYYATGNDVPGGANSDAYKTTNLLMRLIPKGNFMMGSPSGEFGRNSDETQHAVTLTKDFYLGVFEVTQQQWELVMGNRPSFFNNVHYYASRPVEKVSYYDIRENPANSDDPATDWPANSGVNAASFMGRLRAKTGLSTFDLPTESQWEYACRAGTTTALNSGYNLTSSNQDARMDAVGRYWYNGGSGYTVNEATSVGTAKVGSYPPNAWGLYDMHGNASECCLDWRDTYPGTVSDPAGAASGSYRVKRGGSWDDLAYHCRSASRGGNYPSDRSRSTGFRAARTLP
jgi:formylglycine-generating enzyme required for sulfatase activity